MVVIKRKIDMVDFVRAWKKGSKAIYYSSVTKIYRNGNVVVQDDYSGMCATIAKTPTNDIHCAIYEPTFLPTSEMAHIQRLFRKYANAMSLRDDRLKKEYFILMEDGSYATLSKDIYNMYYGFKSEGHGFGIYKSLTSYFWLYHNLVNRTGRNYHAFVGK